MKLNLPNKITFSRLLLAAVFFVLASFDDRAALNGSLAVFVVACLTDFLDGYLARKYHLVTTLGRIADPFVDKVIVCGGFVLLVGRSPYIAPWMVVVLISREFLVSSIRGHAESRGVAFGAELVGKVKAAIQMFAVGFAVSMKANGDLLFLPAGVSAWVTTLTVYVAVVVTVLSAVAYVVKARGLLGSGSPPPADT